MSRALDELHGYSHPLWDSLLDFLESEWRIHVPGLLTLGIYVWSRHDATVLKTRLQKRMRKKGASLAALDVLSLYGIKVESGDYLTAEGLAFFCRQADLLPQSDQLALLLTSATQQTVLA